MMTGLARLQHGARPAWLAFALCLAVLLAAGSRTPARDLSHGDQWFYATAAWDLLRWGTYSDGPFDRVDSAREAPPPGMFMGPGYPFLLAGIMAVDPALRAAATCAVAHVETRDIAAHCPRYRGLVGVVNQFLVAGALGFLFLAARRITGQFPAAALATLFGLAVALSYSRLFSLAMTEGLGLFLFAGAAFFFLRTAEEGGRGPALLGGAMLGLLLLTRPSHMVLAPLALLVLALAALRPRPDWRRLGAACFFTLGLLAATLPWAMRNQLVLGRFALTAGYGPAVLIERMAYNDMTPKEFGMSLIYWLPDFGDGLAERLFGREAVARLNWDLPGSFYDQGQHRRHAALDSPEGVDGMVPTLLRQEVLGRPLAYAASTLSLAWRGLWVGRSWALLLLGLLPFGLVAAWRAGMMRPLLLYAAPAWIMLAVHAGASVNQERYNLALMLGLSITAALGVLALFHRRRQPAAPMAWRHGR